MNADAPRDLSTLAREEPEAVRQVAEMEDDEFREWLLGYLDEYGPIRYKCPSCGNSDLPIQGSSERIIECPQCHNQLHRAVIEESDALIQLSDRRDDIGDYARRLLETGGVSGGEIDDNIVDEMTNKSDIENPKTLAEVVKKNPDGYKDVLEAAEAIESPLADRLREVYEETGIESDSILQRESKTDDQSLYHPPEWDGKYVYIVEADPGVVKIGISGQVQRRIHDLDRANPQSLQLKAAIGVTKPKTVESWIHAELEDYNTKGEWFDIGADKIDDLVDRLISISSVSSF